MSTTNKRDRSGNDGAGRAALDVRTRGVIRSAILRELTHDDRLLLVLHFAEAMSTAEIAMVVGRDTPSVEQRLAEILDAVRGHVRASA